jgi:quercetin dioxygenase-like cupin family protein
MANTTAYHRDKRGTIRDLIVGKDWSVTYITFKKGAVRGNHYHKKTVQTDIVLEGLLANELGGLLAKGDRRTILPGLTHAYQAKRDSAIISICFGKRIGKNYAKDTYKTNGC